MDSAPFDSEAPPHVGSTARVKGGATVAKSTHFLGRHALSPPRSQQQQQHVLGNDATPSTPLSGVMGRRAHPLPAATPEAVSARPVMFAAATGASSVGGGDFVRLPPPTFSPIRAQTPDRSRSPTTRAAAPFFGGASSASLWEDTSASVAAAALHQHQHHHPRGDRRSISALMPTTDAIGVAGRVSSSMQPFNHHHHDSSFRPGISSHAGELHADDAGAPPSPASAAAVRRPSARAAEGAATARAGGFMRPSHMGSDVFMAETTGRFGFGATAAPGSPMWPRDPAEDSAAAMAAPAAAVTSPAAAWRYLPSPVAPSSTSTAPVAAAAGDYGRMVGALAVAAAPTVGAMSAAGERAAIAATAVAGRVATAPSDASGANGGNHPYPGITADAADLNTPYGRFLARSLLAPAAAAAIAGGPRTAVENANASLAPGTTMRGSVTASSANVLGWLASTQQPNAGSAAAAVTPTTPTRPGFGGGVAPTFLASPVTPRNRHPNTTSASTLTTPQSSVDASMHARIQALTPLSPAKRPRFTPGNSPMESSAPGLTPPPLPQHNASTQSDVTEDSAVGAAGAVGSLSFSASSLAAAGPLPLQPQQQRIESPTDENATRQPQVPRASGAAATTNSTGARQLQPRFGGSAAQERRRASNGARVLSTRSTAAAATSACGDYGVSSAADRDDVTAMGDATASDLLDASFATSTNSSSATYCDSRASAQEAQFLWSLPAVYRANAAQNFASRNFRLIPQAPERILDAPDLVDDFYLRLLDWGSANVLAVALGHSMYLWNASNGSITQLAEPSLGGENAGVAAGRSTHITAVAWHADGAALAVALNDGSLELWDAATQRLRGKLHGGAAAVAAAGVTGSSLSPASSRRTTGHVGRIGAMAWNGDLVATGGRDATIRLHDSRVSTVPVTSAVCSVQGSVALLCGHTQEVCGLHWSPCGTRLASGGNDNLVNIWAFPNGSNLPRSGGSATGAAPSPMLMMTPLLQLRRHTAAVKALAWHPTQRGVLATGGGTADKTLCIWNCNVPAVAGQHQNMGTSTTAPRAMIHGGASSSFASSASASSSIGGVGTAYLTSARSATLAAQAAAASIQRSSNNNSVGGGTGHNSSQHHLHPAVSAALGTTAALATAQQQHALGAVPTLTQPLHAVDTQSQICSVLWNAEGTELVTSHGFSDHQLTLWRYPTLKRIADLTGHTARVLHLAASPNGQVVASAAADDSIRFWRCFAPPPSATAPTAAAAAAGASTSFSAVMGARQHGTGTGMGLAAGAMIARGIGRSGVYATAAAAAATPKPDAGDGPSLGVADTALDPRTTPPSSRHPGSRTSHRSTPNTSATPHAGSIGARRGSGMGDMFSDISSPAWGVDCLR